MSQHEPLKVDSPQSYDPDSPASRHVGDCVRAEPPGPDPRLHPGAGAAG